ncbi:hypothetical protein MN116_002418 [Schistosoma mekongi]|uniref:Uncharacterized protein n=1 Tax=Schistosoma mekongi TaxID=38744 RepID=A0AAE1ZK67_SCHME|nr:hypothetical protein MN116_002418 [Schistosoma mekongi]
MRNFHGRISFSEYIYTIKLKNALHNEAYQDNVDFKKNSFINHSSIHFLFNNMESIIFSIDQQSYHNNNHVTIDIDILKCINQCLLITNRSKYQLLSGIKCKVYWHQLARNESFLQCLIHIIPTGYGDPYFQEIAFIVLTNLCIIAGRESKHSAFEECEAALKNLIHIAAGPLVIFSSSSGLGQLTNWSTQALTGLLKATFIYNPNLNINYSNDIWMEKLLLFSHVIHVFHRLLPKIFFIESDNFGSYESLKQFSKYIDDEIDSFNLDILSSFFNLLTLILMKLPTVQMILSISTSSSSSSDDITTIQDTEKFLSIIQYSFMNLCLAIGKVCLCSLCMNNLINFNLFDFLNLQLNNIDVIIMKKCTLNENLSYEVLSFTCKLLKCLLQLIQIPYLKVYFLKTHYNLIHCLLYLSKCLFYCTQSYHSSITSQCILYIIRIIGCICLQYHEININHSISLIKLSNYYLLNNFLLLINWYHQYRCSWSICGVELCWSLTHFIQYFNISIFQQQSNPLLDCFINSFLFKLYSLDYGCKELHIETFIYLLKFLSLLININLLKEYIVMNCIILHRLCNQCDQILKMLSTVASLELLTIEQIVQMICTLSLSTDIISYIMSIIEYIQL